MIACRPGYRMEQPITLHWPMRKHGRIVPAEACVRVSASRQRLLRSGAMPDMDDIQQHEVGRHRVRIACRDGIGGPTPYSLFLAEHIPQMPGWTAVDVGTWSGFLAIVARLQGAARVYMLDTNPQAVP